MGISYSETSVLLVEDDFVALELYKTLLGAIGIGTIFSAETGAAAASAVTDRHPRTDSA